MWAYCKAHSAGFTKYKRCTHVKTYSGTGKHGFPRRREIVQNEAEGSIVQIEIKILSTDIFIAK